MTPDTRYAIYLVPPADSALWKRACRWLGRDPETGAALAQPEVPGYAGQKLRHLTQPPRQYGFHATLKAPFRLAAGLDESRLMQAVADLIGALPALSLPALRVDNLGAFIALRP